MFKPECTRAPFQPATFPGPSTPTPGPSTPFPGPAGTVPVPVAEASKDPLDNFTETVRNFVSIDKRIAELAAEMKVLRAESANLKESICVFMEQRDIEDLHTRTMRLKLKTSLVKPPLKKAELRSRVAEYLGGDEQADTFFAKVYEREGVEKTSLRRIKTRKS
jgi:hypothetical protein